MQNFSKKKGIIFASACGLSLIATIACITQYTQLQEIRQNINQKSQEVKRLASRSQNLEKYIVEREDQWSQEKQETTTEAQSLSNIHP